MQCISFNIDLESTAKINLYTLILAPGLRSSLSDLKEERRERERERKRKKEGRRGKGSGGKEKGEGRRGKKRGKDNKLTTIY